MYFSRLSLGEAFLFVPRAYCGPFEVEVSELLVPQYLNTPRLVADAAGTTVWKWDQQEPFGNNVADENPSGLGAFDLTQRLPGQYFDRETNLHRSEERRVGKEC